MKGFSSLEVSNLKRAIISHFWGNMGHGISSRPKIHFCTSSERPLSKLPESHKINVIGMTELMLCPFKRCSI